MLRTISQQLERIVAILLRIERLLSEEHEETMADISALTAAISKETTVEASVLALLTGLQSEVANLQPTQAAIDALAQQINTNIAALSAAVPANTPSATAVSGGGPVSPAPATP